MLLFTFMATLIKSISQWISNRNSIFSEKILEKAGDIYNDLSSDKIFYKIWAKKWISHGNSLSKMDHIIEEVYPRIEQGEVAFDYWMGAILRQFQLNDYKTNNPNKLIYILIHARAPMYLLAAQKKGFNVIDEHWGKWSELNLNTWKEIDNFFFVSELMPELKNTTAYHKAVALSIHQL